MSSKIEWNKLINFYQVAYHQSISKAADVLHISQSALSKQILDLEYRLQKELFYRHTRGVTLTEAGQILYASVAKMIAECEAAMVQIHEHQGCLNGSLRIATTSFFASMWLVNYIAEFIREHPNLKIEIIGEDKEPGLHIQDAEVALHPYIYDRPDLVQRYIKKPWRWSLYASPQYLEKWGVPQAPEDLDHHRLVAFGSAAPQPFPNINWLLRLGTKLGHERKPIITVNSAFAMLAIAQEHLGIVTLSDEHVAVSGSDLVRILPQCQGPVVETYYIYPKQLENSPKVQIFGAYIEKKFGLEISSDFKTAMNPTMPSVIK
jgi:DNA-binding transcriptional LysR family regulator